MHDTPAPSSTPARLVRHGASLHLVIETVEDLRQILAFDTAHWVASAAPLGTINEDPDFLEMLDDGDGRIKAEEVRQTLAWMLDALVDHTGVLQASEALELDAIHPDRPKLRATARRVLDRSEDPEARSVTLAQVRAVRVAEQERGLSAAGLVTPSVEAPREVTTLIETILATSGGVPHPHEEAAVDAPSVDAFFDQIARHLDWREEAATTSDLCPFGDQTEAVADLVTLLAPKFAQYFTLCDAIELDERLTVSTWLDAERLEKLDMLDPEALHAFLRRAPIATPRSDGQLPPDAHINPVWAEPLGALDAMLPDARPTTQAHWHALIARLEPWRAWQAREPGVEVRSLTIDQERELLEDAACRQALDELIERSHTESVVLERVRQLERLVSTQAHMLRFVNSFVSFPDLYDPGRRALFEMGTLVIDGRRLTLAMRVTDRERHARFSDASNIFVLYVEILAHAGTVLHEVAVPVTHGGQGNLLESKWGVFYDIQGREYHARVVQIVDNPISLIEAILAPFKRVARSLNERIEAFSQQRQQALLERSTKATDETGGSLLGSIASGPNTSAPAPAAPPAAKRTPPAAAKPAPAPASGVSNVLAGGAVAVAALGSSAAFITSTIQRLDTQTVALGIVGFFIALMTPLTLAAWLKLRRRDLSALLEGSGWAINARMRLTRPQARTFTFTPDFPEDAVGKPWPWWVWAILVILVVGALVALGILQFGPKG